MRNVSNRLPLFPPNSNFAIGSAEREGTEIPNQRYNNVRIVTRRQYSRVLLPHHHPSPTPIRNKYGSTTLHFGRTRQRKEISRTCFGIRYKLPSRSLGINDNRGEKNLLSCKQNVPNSHTDMPPKEYRVARTETLIFPLIHKYM